MKGGIARAPAFGPFARRRAVPCGRGQGRGGQWSKSEQGSGRSRASWGAASVTKSEAFAVVLYLECLYREFLARCVDGVIGLVVRVSRLTPTRNGVTDSVIQLEV